jgi:hypothetical protein
VSARAVLLRLVLPLAGAALLACPAEPPPPELPSAALLARAEQRLETERAALADAIGHYGLVHEIPDAMLARFMAQIVVHRAGDDRAFGARHGLELHGGGVLGLLVEHWRPDGRRARPDDRYPFAWSPEPVALAGPYGDYRSQLFLPVPGVATAAIDGRLPDAPALARVRFGARDLDAYALLRVLLRFEPDLDAAWTNRVGQRLRARLVLEQLRDHYLVDRGADVEGRDHSYLHAVEVLLAFAERERREGGAPDLAPLQQRLLDVELRRTRFGPLAPSEALGHHVEALGLLLEQPGLAWSDVDQRRVLDWLAGLEARGFDPIESVPVEHLAHLVRGLRKIETNRSRLF